jgi:hypothetical protein
VSQALLRAMSALKSGQVTARLPPVAGLRDGMLAAGRRCLPPPASALLPRSLTCSLRCVEPFLTWCWIAALLRALWGLNVAFQLLTGSQRPVVSASLLLQETRPPSIPRPGNPLSAGMDTASTPLDDLIASTSQPPDVPISLQQAEPGTACTG